MTGTTWTDDDNLGDYIVETKLDHDERVLAGMYDHPRSEEIWDALERAIGDKLREHQGRLEGWSPSAVADEVLKRFDL